MTTTVDLGRVAPIYRGTYSASATYEPLDFLSYNGASYYCVATTTAGILPTNTAYFVNLNSTGGVTSFNGRSGAVSPIAGDYPPALIGAVPTAGGTMTGRLNVNETDDAVPIIMRTADGYECAIIIDANAEVNGYVSVGQATDGRGYFSVIQNGIAVRWLFDYSTAYILLPGGGKLANNGDLYINKGNGGLLGWVSEIIQGLRTVPVGTLAYYAASTPPSGWLERNGAAISRTTYAALFAVIGTTYGTGDGSTTFNLPDDRGLFDRAWDDGAGVDSGRTFGSTQADEVKSHTHSISGGSNSTGNDYPTISGSGTDYTVSTGATGGTETRPKNRAYLPIIKY